MKRPALTRPSPKRGIALIAVLWIVAALSILVTGIVNAVRSEVRLSSTARERVVAGAMGDAAINLVLQEMLATPRRPTRLLSVSKSYQGQDISVQIVPLTGYINLNSAPLSLLTSLFAVGAHLNADAASALAQAVVDARQQRDAVGRPMRLEATEDLMRIPGLDYGVYASIQPLVTADLFGGGQVNPLAAPPEVLLVLTDGDPARAAKVAADRDAGADSVDVTALNTAFTSANSSTNRYRLQARVPLADGAWFWQSRVVELNAQPKEGLPWKVYRTESRVEKNR